MADTGPINVTDTDWPTVECAFPGCTNRLSMRTIGADDDGHGGRPDREGRLGKNDQWCSVKHRDGSEGPFSRAGSENGLTAGASGIELIRAERRRQAEVEGWTTAHDDSHGPAALLAAADCYAFYRPGDTSPPSSWPWDATWWKPKDRLRNLVRAGALAQASEDSAVRRGEEARAVFAAEMVRKIADHIDSLVSAEGPVVSPAGGENGLTAVEVREALAVLRSRCPHEALDHQSNDFASWDECTDCGATMNGEL